MRDILANVAAAVVAGIVAVAVVLGVSLAVTERELQYAAWNAVPLMAPIGLATALLSLLPFCLLAQRSGRFSLGFAVLAGLFLGAAMSVAIALLNQSTSGLANLLLLCSGAGGFAGFAYYFVYRGLRPNNSSKPTSLGGAA